MNYMDKAFTEQVPRLYEKDDKHLLARGFVLYQKFEHVYSPVEALKRGTAFEELDKPEYRKDTAVSNWRGANSQCPSKY